jgi:hypothetical protein
MKERPILFNGDMVRAILEGRKTQTRRPIKNLPECAILDTKRDLKFQDPHMAEWLLKTLKCPFGQPGDRLWVRETWCRVTRLNDCYSKHSNLCGGVDSWDYYKADEKSLPAGFNWKPSIHMPREASRIILKIDEIRVERVQDIAEDDAEAEGTPARPDIACAGTSARIAFAEVWDSIYFKQGADWQKNPLVWVVKFHRVEAQR